MKKIMLLKQMLWLLVCPMFFESCESKLDEHYEEPVWLKGSSWKVLESDKNYSIFLEGIKRAGYEQIVAGKNILTIMAPNDEAFKTYFAAHEPVITSLNELSDAEVKKLIGFHIMYYSYNTQKLINFRPEGDGISEENAKIAAGMYYKHRTKSIDPISTAFDTLNNAYKIYHTERFLPVFSYKLFESLDLDAKTNYEYFYPNSTWTGDQSFNVSNASVIGEEIITNNGYLYKLDQVLKPLETIYTELKNNPDYSKFLSLYDSYSYFLYDAEASTNYGNGDSLYYHKHQSPLADIACEWPVNDYTQIAMLSNLTYSLFAPSNDALDNIFNTYWKNGGYSSLKDVSSIALAYLIRNCSFSNLVFPEAISKGDVENIYGTAIDFDVNTVPESNRKVCSNGLLYELTSLKIPGMFKSVTGPAFKNKKFSDYLYMLDASSMVIAMASEDVQFTVLMPTNTQMANSGYVMLDGKLCDEADDYTALKASDMTNYVNLHTVTGGDGISFSGTQVLETNNPQNYWFVKDGKLTTSALFNQILEATDGSEPDPYFAISEVVGNWSNGKVYTYENTEILSPLASSPKLKELLVTNDKNYKYYYFSKLLDKAELITRTDGVGQINTGGLRNLYFIPTNEAFQAALQANKIPGVKGDIENLQWDGEEMLAKTQLALYMSRYIVNASISNVAYPYIGCGINGFYYVPVTYKNNGTIVNGTLQIIDNGNKLSVAPAIGTQPIGASVNVVSTYDYFPFAYTDGCVHFLEDVFTIE